MGIVMFPDTVNHDWMARQIGQEVVGAGFVFLDISECYGESTTLGIRSTEADTKLLRRQTYFEA
jgi:hypothetical protein